MIIIMHRWLHAQLHKSAGSVHSEPQQVLLQWSDYIGTVCRVGRGGSSSASCYIMLYTGLLVVPWYIYLYLSSLLNYNDQTSLTSQPIIPHLITSFSYSNLNQKKERECSEIFLAVLRIHITHIHVVT